MLVVLRVKEIPPDSSGGNFFALIISLKKYSKEGTGYFISSVSTQSFSR
jgi:hypothetical protein